MDRESVGVKWQQKTGAGTVVLRSPVALNQHSNYWYFAAMKYNLKEYIGGLLTGLQIPQERYADEQGN